MFIQHLDGCLRLHIAPNSVPSAVRHCSYTAHEIIASVHIFVCISAEKKKKNDEFQSTSHNKRIQV